MTHNNPHRRHARGFSLLELIVVLLMLSTLAAAVVPIYGGSVQSIRMRGFHSNFVQFITYVQERAVTDVREYRLYIDDKEKTYWVMEHTGWDRDDKVYDVAGGDLGEERYFPESVEVSRISGEKDRGRDGYYMTCFPNGSCDRIKVYLNEDGDRRRQVIIETTGVIGKIEVDDYRNRRR
jgi:prepilin-type N-terminal cleavage/methylation domain-containing protein